MADTKRTVADMIANLFQDGQVAGISAQDIRDLVVSMQPSYGSFSMTTPAATNVVAAGTYYKAAGTTTFDASKQDMDDGASPTSNRLRYTGTPDRYCELFAACTVISTTNNQTVGLKLAVNGVVVDDSYAQIKINNSTDIRTVTLVGHATLSTNDYVEVWLTNETSTGSIITLQEVHCMLNGWAV